MALVFNDRVLETSTTTGTGAFTLSAAVTGYQRFADAMSTSDTCYYAIFAVDANGNPSGAWETGLGTYSSANTLTRTTPQQSSNSDNAVDFAAGTKYVMLSPTAAFINTLYRSAGTDVALADGGTGASLADPGADRIMFWDDSEGAVTWLTAGTGLSISGTTITAAASTAWALVGTGQTATGVWDQAVDGSKTNIDFAGLGSVNELLVVMDALTAASSGVRSLQVSVDNGSTFYSAVTDYQVIAVTGVKTNTDSMGFHNTSTTAARSHMVHIINTKGPIKIAQSGAATNQVFFSVSASDINAIRILNIGGGGNITGGTIRVYGR